MSGIPWSDLEVDALRQLADKGYSVKQIVESGVMPGRSYAAMHRKASMCKISLSGPKPVLDMKKLKEMLSGSNRIKGNTV